MAISNLDAAVDEMSGKKRSYIEALTANGIVEVLNSTAWILPENSLEAESDPGRILYKQDILFEYTLDLRFNPSARIKSYRSRRTGEYFYINKFWDIVRVDPYFRTHDFKVFFKTDILEKRKITPAGAGTSFRNPSAPRDAPRDQRLYMGSTFDQFWVWFDWPMHALAMEWLAASGPKEIPVRYNPDNPEDFLDEATYQKAVASDSVAYSVFSAGALFTIGGIVFVLGFCMLTKGMNRRLQVISLIIILATIPFWSSYMQKIMTYMGIPSLGKKIIQEMTDSMDVRLRAGFLEEMPELDKSEYTVLPVDVSHSRYKDIYDHFELSGNPEKNKTFDTAIQDISAQITSQIKKIPKKDLFRFYKVLDAHISQRRKGWDAPLLQSTKEMAVDTTRSANLRSWVISVLSDMCSALDDPKLAEFMYTQYISCSEDVRKYWRQNMMNFYQVQGFKEDINSSDPDRIKRAMNVWMNKRLFKEKIQFLIPRLKTLTRHPDSEIRELACKKWDSRKDLGKR